MELFYYYWDFGLSLCFIDVNGMRFFVWVEKCGG